MKQRPWPIVILAILHIVAPIGNILSSALLSGVPLKLYWHALLLPENRMTLLMFTVIPIIGAVLIYTCKRWSYYAYIALMLLPFFFSIQEYMAESTPAMAVGLVIFFIVNMTVVGYFLLPTVRRLYFDPRLRWWETKPRYKTDFQCQIELEDQQHWVEIKNISEGGAFLETAAELPEDTLVKLFFKDQQGVISLVGQVVYKRDSKPLGYGFQFDKQSSKEPRLKELIKKLAAEGALIHGRLPGPEDTFVGWMKSNVSGFKKKLSS